MARRMNKIAFDVPELGPAVQADAYEWIMEQAPPYYAECIELAVINGRTSDEIFRYMLRETGRREISLRCKHASQYLISQQS